MTVTTDGSRLGLPSRFFEMPNVVATGDHTLDSARHPLQPILAQDWRILRYSPLAGEAKIPMIFSNFG
jgi:hypothetical protein